MSSRQGPVRILLVEDSSDDAFLIEAELSKLGMPLEIRCVDDAGGLGMALRELDWDLVVSDFRLPRFNGLQALEQVRAFDPDLPFILASGWAAEETAVKAMHAGARDYVMKGNLTRLCPAVERELGEAAMRQARVLAERRLAFLASHDAVTHLGSRRWFLDQVAQALAAASVQAVAIVEIDRFKDLCAAQPQDSIDALLRRAAASLSRICGADRVARAGDDRFAVYFDPGEDAAAALDQLLNPSTAWETRASIPFSFQAGLAPATPGIDAEALVLQAEAALARARAASDRACVTYDATIGAEVVSRGRLEALLGGALQRGELTLHYQPQMALEDGAICGLEALLRWRSPVLGNVNPADFIPVLERTGLIQEVGIWVLRTALADRARWRELGIAPPSIAVNVSSLQVARADFVRHVRQAVEGHELDGIHLELTESVLMEDVEACVAKLAMLRQLGIRIVIDDFGIGYSSLAYLARLPVQALKIDRAFVQGMQDDRNMEAVVKSVVGLAHGLDLKVIAEGIETASQLQAIRELGCDQAQGYHLGRPRPFHEVALLLGGPSMPRVLPRESRFPDIAAGPQTS